MTPVNAAQMRAQLTAPAIGDTAYMVERRDLLALLDALKEARTALEEIEAMGTIESVPQRDAASAAIARLDALVEPEDAP